MKCLTSKLMSHFGIKCFISKSKFYSGIKCVTPQVYVFFQNCMFYNGMTCNYFISEFK